MTRAMRRMRKYLLVVACIALVLGVAIGGTIAWLTDETDPVVNTFAPSNIGLTLEETADDSFKMIPGETDAKDPKVTITNDVDAWLFVEIDESWTTSVTTTVDGNEVTTTYTLDQYLDYTLNTTDWIRGDDKEIPASVWYREVAADADTKEWYLLQGKGGYANGYVAYEDDVTVAMMSAITTGNYPKLTFTAYAIQKANGDGTEFTAAQAWKTLNP